MAQRIEAPEMAVLMAQGLTEGEAKSLEKELAKVARAYGRAQVRVRSLKAQLHKAEQAAKTIRREMRMLVSVRRVK